MQHTVYTMYESHCSSQSIKVPRQLKQCSKLNADIKQITHTHTPFLCLSQQHTHNVWENNPSKSWTRTNSCPLSNLICHLQWCQEIWLRSHRLCMHRVRGQIFTVSDLYDLLSFLNHHKRTLQLHYKPNWVVKHEIKHNGMNNIWSND